MINGIQIDYKVKKRKNCRVAQLMYGRISKVTRNNKVSRFYEAGIFDQLPYQKIFNGRIFVVTDEKPDFSDVLYYCEEFIISSVAKEDIALKPITGRDKWKLYSKEKGWDVNGFKTDTESSN